MFTYILETIVLVYPTINTLHYFSLRLAEEKPVYNPKDVHFLATWWSVYGLISFTENITPITHIPFYSIGKVAFITALCFDNYQGYILKTTRNGATQVINNVKESSIYKETKQKVITLCGYELPTTTPTPERSVLSFLSNFF